ncbi:dUTP diphosphatase [Pelagibacterales bacterium]|jgi:dUTP pyrophosphatase|nr:dUTP diphosphatase [Pelagibacterales bacterium]MDB9818246.1 dUTP diphosphatase [Pelagibacterales bacterium]|tara:strand:- start:2456 stop:2905 length:450 start_codon:yes stop_codon:yes gene_type:complete
MPSIKVYIKKISSKSDFKLPNYETKGAAGMDLSADIESEVILKPLERSLIPTGIAISLPKDLEAQIRPRSGLAIKHGITLLNTPGTIDSDYRGEIKVILVNLSNDNYTIKPQDRIAQIVFSRFVTGEFDIVENLDETDRGESGFGSTGK